MERGSAFWTYDDEAGAWYLGLDDRSPPPYTDQRRVEAILDLDADGRLAGVELLEPIQPPARNLPKAVEGLEGVNRAPHMERYTRVRPYRTEEHRDGHKVELVIGVQGFILSDGVGNHHESRAAAEWSRRQLCLALDTLRSEVIEECAKIADELSDSASDHEAGAALGIAERIRALKGRAK